jgi:hypothetical protein
MRTTLNLDDEIMRSLKRRAAETGRTLTSLVEEALRSLLDGGIRAAPDYRLHWRIVEGGARPGIDLSDRDALMDLMDGRG